MTQSFTVAPLLLGPKNCEQMTGLPWRHVRDHARELGVEPVRVGRKLVVPAARFLEALESSNATSTLHSDDAPTDPAEALRARLGLRLAGETSR
jgi:hypothetical protein